MGSLKEEDEEEEKKVGEWTEVEGATMKEEK